jgi:hypothetical protein
VRERGPGEEERGGTRSVSGPIPLVPSLLPPPPYHPLPTHADDENNIRHALDAGFCFSVACPFGFSPDAWALGAEMLQVGAEAASSMAAAAADFTARQTFSVTAPVTAPHQLLLRPNAVPSMLLGQGGRRGGDGGALGVSPSSGAGAGGAGAGEGASIAFGSAGLIVSETPRAGAHGGGHGGALACGDDEME